MAVRLVERPPERAPVERLLCRLATDVRRAEARIREVHGYGVNLRFVVRDPLVDSPMFRDHHALKQLAAEQLEAFTALGWIPVPVHCCD